LTNYYRVVGGLLTVAVLWTAAEESPATLEKTWLERVSTGTETTPERDETRLWLNAASIAVRVQGLEPLSRMQARNRSRLTTHCSIPNTTFLIVSEFNYSLLERQNIA